MSAAALTGFVPLRSMAAEITKANDGEFFVFVHASGGWDVTLWADPRNEMRGIVHPASTENTDKAQLRLWVDAPLSDGNKTFELVRPKRSNLVFGPGIGALAEMPDRITVVNGLAMNTVAHPDGATFSATGRHPQGGRVAASSIDTMLANELGTEQLLPTVSLRFPSAFVGDKLDRRAVPLAVDDVGSVGRTLFRAQAFDSNAERDKVTALLSEEAADLAKRSTYPGVLDGLDLQYQSLRRMLGTNLQEVFTANSLRQLRPEFNYKARFAGGPSVNAAFAVEAMKRNIVRCVSFACGSFDTHGNNYRTHAQNQQELFDMVATLLKALDQTPHPTKTGKKLSDHAHIMVISEFCRTPQINLAMGRDHYPNNSALVVSPRFKTNMAFGKTDVEQLLPMPAKTFTDGERAIAPPDLLATMLGAFAIDPRKYMRDGEVVKELLVA
ncbi:hypothetical protein AKJ09_02260 [Labilithrix luteola]|uniref:DUF1501 domain-containing protein n=1 Tax=Labilithrix luteola TaxID=1391654 RepID=A0A0K1PQC5_9BACT|nr:hypothetical protein AKJ09_02260 [Labilithrix luteola]